MADPKSSTVVRLQIAEVEERLGIEKSTIYRWYKSGKFPAPHYIGERRVWFLAEVEAWELKRMVEQATGRRGARNLAATTPSTVA